MQDANDPPTEDPLITLRTAILALTPSGSAGFEGLLAQVLSGITGYDFRLAKSGHQQGKDGGNAPWTATTITFEGKRYKGPIPRNEVLAKIPALKAAPGQPDLWVLGATVEVGTQLQDEVVSECEKAGIIPLFLDWPEASAVPPLAAACAMAAARTEAFLKQHSSTDVAKLATALARIRDMPEFQRAAWHLNDFLLNPLLGLPQAKAANATWVDERLKDRKKARSSFGQAISPLADSPVPTRKRPDQLQHVCRFMSAQPDDQVMAVLGPEGRGKSWLVAQSWLELEDKPLLLFVPASRIKGPGPYNGIHALLVEHLIEQTGAHADDRAQARWTRNLKRWEAAGKGASPRFILWVDGLNQNTAPEWALWLDSACELAERYGGALVVTCRTAFFQERIRPSLGTTVTEHEVPDWTDAEVKEILGTRGIAPDRMNHDVIQSLRNPRIIGIALGQLDAGSIKDLTELNEARLLFEHMRQMATEPNMPKVPEFSRRLAGHAKEVIERHKAQQFDDLLVFDRTEAGSVPHRLDAALQAVVSEAYCKPLQGDSTQYSISEPGLVLALGLWVRERLLFAHRNHHDLDEHLSAILEPVEALDRLAEVVLAAVTVAALQEDPNEMVAALMVAFARLQNPPVGASRVFAAAVRKNAAAAMSALEYTVGRTSVSVANTLWLEESLRVARSNEPAWQAMGPYIERWLRCYTLDPSVAALNLRGSSSPSEIEVELTKSAAKLRTKLEALSEGERRFLEHDMYREDALDCTALQHQAYVLLAGMPIAGFGQALVASRFSHALNSGYSRSTSEFMALVQFNCVDWPQAQEALLTAAIFLAASDVSATGQWARVSVLRACATLAEEREADSLVAELTRDRPPLESWRMVERYCSTDPCDPDSHRPENLDETVGRAHNLDVSSFHRELSTTEQDLFFDMALCGLARFAPDAAIALQNRVARSIIADFPNTRLTSVHRIKEHCAVLEADSVEALRVFGSTDAVQHGLGSEEAREAQLAQELALILAFAHLSGDEQLETLAGIEPQRSPWLERSRFFRSADTGRLERILQAAIEDNDEKKLIGILQFACDSGTPPSDLIVALTFELINSNGTFVRALALQWVAKFEHQDALSAVCASDWTAARLDPSGGHSEIWAGSWCLVLAAEKGLCGWQDVIDRITPGLYGELARRVANASHEALASRIWLALRRAVEAEVPVAGPAVEMVSSSLLNLTAPRLSLSDQADADDLNAFARALAETPTEFRARQRRNWDAFQQFEKALSRQGARLFIEDVGQAAVEAVIAATPDGVATVVELLRTLSRPQRGPTANFAVRFAKALSEVDSSAARELFAIYSDQQPAVRRISGLAKIDLATSCIWESAASPEIEELWTERLDRAANDDALAQEVNAALLAGKSAFLQAYAKQALSHQQPSVVCRGLMVLGFSINEEVSEKLINDYMEYPGLIGHAAKAAKFALDRNKWARHWHRQMCAATSKPEFWLNSVLFLKVVDARFDLWGPEEGKAGELLERFYPTLGDELSKRVKRWKSKREKKLFGLDAPNPAFLTRAVSVA